MVDLTTTVTTGSETLPKQGGVCFYSQNAPGSPWFDGVSNSVGWTVNFNLQTVAVENSNIVSSISSEEGSGIFVNDGSRKESIYFFPQEIVFKNANKTFVYDTSTTNDYTLLGKGNSLKLFGRPSTASAYSLIGETTFLEKSSPQGNGTKASSFEDPSGSIHVVWQDDGNKMGQIFYSKLEPIDVLDFSTSSWSDPELISSNFNNASNPQICVDSLGTIHVVFQTIDVGEGAIAYLSKNDLGWSDPEFIGVGEEYAKGPRIALDSSNNVIVVWEDNRLGQPEIYYNKKTHETMKWLGDTRVTTSGFGSTRPSISCYLDTLYVGYSQKLSTGYKSIKILSINMINGVISSPSEVTEGYFDEDGVNVLALSSGDVCVAWHKLDNNYYSINVSRYNSLLSNLNGITEIEGSNGNARFPIMGEFSQDGSIYLVYTDYPVSPEYYDPEYLPKGDIYYSRYTEDLGWTPGDYISYNLEDKDCSNVSIPPRFSVPSVVYDLHLFTDVVYSGEPLSSQNLFRLVGFFFFQYDSYLTAMDEYFISSLGDRKEIRFGCFSSNLSSHLIFKNFGYYTKDAVEPLNIVDLSKTTFNPTSFAVKDTAISNFGDAWLANANGILYYSDNGVFSVDFKVDGTLITKARCISYDKSNYMFVGSESGLYYSASHIEEYKKLSEFTDVRATAFDRNNKLFVGTGEGLTYSLLTDTDGTITASTVSVIDGYDITSISIDENNVVWVGTSSGLFRYSNSENNSRLLLFTTANGLPSDRINDVAIRNSMIRYIATSSGISKMNGTTFENLSSQDGVIYNDNVKSLCWREPNVLWAGTQSNINQIIIDDDTNSYSGLVFEPEDFSGESSKHEEYETFYLLPEKDISILDQDFISNYHVEVYLNGNLLGFGYEISLSPNPIIKFKTKLLPSDVVKVIVRGDIIKMSSFEQTIKEKQVVGEKAIRIEDVGITDSSIYLVTKGAENEVKINDESSPIPFDSIFLDTNPPTGKINIVQQVSKSFIEVEIGDVEDIDPDNDDAAGSGVESMIVSNYPNFTTDGVTPQTAIPFTPNHIHDLGVTLDRTNAKHTFENGMGSAISLVDGSFFAGTKAPYPALYWYNVETNNWEELDFYGVGSDVDYSVDFIAKINGKLVVSVGGLNGQMARIFIYIIQYNDLQQIISLSSPPAIQTISEPRALACVFQNNMLYFCSGFGTEGGKIRCFDGMTTTIIASNLGSSLLGLTKGTSTSLIAGGTELVDGIYKAKIYEINLKENSSSNIFTDTDTQITCMTYAELNGKAYVFAGTSTEGKILKSQIESYSFGRSFKALPAAVTAAKTVTTSTGLSTVYVGIDKTLFQFSNSGVWTFRYEGTETIRGIDADPVTGYIYIVSDTKITEVAPLTQTKNVYLKLIDRAGNESLLYTSDADLDVNKDGIVDDMTDSIFVGALKDFISENKIVEISSSGLILYALTGDGKYYSANRVGSEKGIYESEIFNAGNDLIKWETLSWQGTELEDTVINMYIRSSDNSTDILDEMWMGPYPLTQSSGIDISFLSGPCFQFKVELVSAVEGITPIFYKALVSCVTGSSVHFFTTNFVLTSPIRKGILTSQKLLPVASDIVFGINTTDSTNWSDYQVIDENRVFQSLQSGSNLRIGIKFLTPMETTVDPTNLGAIDPYGVLHINTVDFRFDNTSGSLHDYHFKVSLYDDYNMTNEIYSIFSADDPISFSADDSSIPETGLPIVSGSGADIRLIIAGNADLICNNSYYTKIEAAYLNGSSYEYETVSSLDTFVASCASFFVDDITFDFTNTGQDAGYFHFRIRYYRNEERTNLYMTEFSGNDITNWESDGEQIPESGIYIGSGGDTEIYHIPNRERFTPGVTYYMIIDRYDGIGFEEVSSSYNFQVRDTDEEIYCGDVSGVPVVKNFGIMFELEDGSLIKLNSSD